MHIAEVFWKKSKPTMYGMRYVSALVGKRIIDANNAVPGREFVSMSSVRRGELQDGGPGTHPHIRVSWNEFYRCYIVFRTDK